jgi:hypothetical protein
MLSDRHADLYHEVRRKPRRGSVSVSWPVREGVLLTSNRLRSWAERGLYTGCCMFGGDMVGSGR